MIKRAIIVAAGMGRRLAPYTDDRPKCMVEVKGRSILERQIEAYRAAGIDDICVVRGYRSDDIRIPHLRYFENPDYRRNNILASLFFAEAAMDEGFYFSYSDIVFRPEVVRTLAAAPAAVDYALVVDRRWDEAYLGRDLHPIAEAELLAVESREGARGLDGMGGTDGARVVAVGKCVVPAAEAFGEFIGLARFSTRAAARMTEDYRRLQAELGPEAPFGTAKRFESAYLSDMLNYLIGAGEVMRAVEIFGGWREIDTTQDLERARELVDW